MLAAVVSSVLPTIADLGALWEHDEGGSAPRSHVVTRPDVSASWIRTYELGASGNTRPPRISLIEVASMNSFGPEAYIADIIARIAWHWQQSRSHPQVACRGHRTTLTHDLQRSVVTGMNEIGIAPHIVEAVVNDVSGWAKAGVAGVYNRATYSSEKRVALQAWADPLDEVLRHGERKVIPIRAWHGVASDPLRRRRQSSARDSVNVGAARKSRAERRDPCPPGTPRPSTSIGQARGQRACSTWIPPSLTLT
jgi:hypothetical protein